MTLDADRQNELDHTWMDSLLHEALTNDSDREQARINALFAKPEFDSPEPNSTVDRRFSSRARWLPIAIAASIAIVLGCWSLFSDPNQRAYAAIARGLRPSSVNREYAIRIVTNTPSGVDVTKHAQLFLDSANRFVIHRRGWLGFGDVWIGNDGNNQWVVPRFGPVIIGSERILGGWLAKKDSTAPYLHIQTILKRMEKGYALQMLSDTSVDGPTGRLLCERVQGELKDRNKQPSNAVLPVAIELWADKETGVAHRVVLHWQREPNEAGPIQWTIDLQGFPSLSSDWFEPAGHSAPGQRIVKLGNEAELEALSRSREEPL